MKHEISTSALDSACRGDGPGSAFMGNRIGTGVEYARPEHGPPDGTDAHTIRAASLFAPLDAKRHWANTVTSEVVQDAWLGIKHESPAEETGEYIDTLCLLGYLCFAYLDQRLAGFFFLCAERIRVDGTPSFPAAYP